MVVLEDGNREAWGDGRETVEKERMVTGVS